MITGFFAGILALFYVSLSLNVIRKRRKHQVPILDGGNEMLARAMRAQGNFAEYTPITLFMMVLLEAQNTHPTALYILGSFYLTARIMHAYSLLRREVNFGQRAMDFRFRIAGMWMTFIVIIGLAILNITHYIFGFIL